MFDIDGVLVEVMQSYREAIRETVRHFTGELVSQDEIQDFKNAGGWNNDWLLSQRLILDRGKNVEYADIVEHFNQVFLGENGDGLIRYERWMPRAGLLERLRDRATLAIFTGRAKYEADVTLTRYAEAIKFEPLVTDESVANPKPAPDGLQLIQREHPNKNIWYLGDTVDDARSANTAGVPFIGVAAPSNPLYLDLVFLFQGEGAYAIIDDINYLGEVFEE